jgi:hypothetical protein
MNAQPRSTNRVVRLRFAARLAALAAPVLACAVGSTAPAGAATAQDAPARIARGGGAVTSVPTTATTQPVVPVAESWYRPLSALCTTPAGCPPVELPPGYPDGTLHVGVLGGAPDSSTYISLPLPATGLAGGSLRLPIGPAQDGTLQPESAKVKACVVPGTVKDKIAGSWSTRPNPDCSSSSPGVVTASGSGSILTFDLAPFLVEWDGLPVGSLAIVPADTPANTDLWHLAFSRHDRTAAGAQPLSATLLVNVVTPTSSVDVPAVGEPGVVPDSGPPVLEPPALGTGVVPGVTGPVPTVDDPSLTAARTPGLRPVAALAPDTSFTYPAVFLLPPLVLVAAGWAARSFTRDLADEHVQ